ncbi:Crp/Fnr family transcriptional regulator [Paracoccus sp. 22332]|uniref:Crp/Fnr family transcriptional regulator n=1 Tax=Paracoccus sp. 22332 TaxID=3453913 RepID=UPI003F871E11
MTCPVRYRAVCAHCGPADLHDLEAIRFFHSYEAGQVIVWADERLDFVATVVSGIVSLTRIMADGRTQMVGMLRAGNFLGHPYRAKVAYNAVAATPVVLCGFHRQRFETLLRKTPALSQGLLEQSMGELDAAREWMLLLGRMSTAVQNPATRRRKTRPGGGGLRHGARAYHRAGACHGALAPWGQIEAI